MGVVLLHCSAACPGLGGEGGKGRGGREGEGGQVFGFVLTACVGFWQTGQISQSSGLLALVIAIVMRHLDLDGQPIISFLYDIYLSCRLLQCLFHCWLKAYGQSVSVCH